MLPHRSVRERRGTSSTARVSEVAHTMSCAGSITASDALNFALQDDNNEAECSTARTHDGQFAQFTMLNKAWRAPKLHHTFLGARCFDGAFRNVAKTMSQLLGASEHASSAQAMEGLANAQPATALTIGRDADTGDALLGFESEVGGISVRLRPEMLRELRSALDQHDNESRDRLAAE